MKDRTHIITTPSGMRILIDLTAHAVIRPAFSPGNIAMCENRLQLANGIGGADRRVEIAPDGTWITIRQLYAAMAAIASHSGKPVDVVNLAASWLYEPPDDLCGRIERLFKHVPLTEAYWRPILAKSFYSPLDHTIYPHERIN